MVNGVSLIPLSGATPATAPAGVASPRALPAFVAGPENALAVTALAPWIDRAGHDGGLLVLYGPHASGKSHLAVGLAEHWRRHDPSAQVVCLAGAEFAQAYTQALTDGRLDDWRIECRSAALFVLDDLGELRDKRPAQRELLRTLDALEDSGGAVLVTARSLPSHWSALLPALRSRLSAGLSVPLAYPSRAARQAIVEQLSAPRGLTLATGVLEGLAGQLEGSVPALVAALLELEMASRVGSVDGKRACALLAPRKSSIDVTLREIACAAAKYFSLKLSDLKSPSRRRSLVAGRGVAMFLARNLTAMSLEQIGDFFGGRDHTTVLHACRRTEKLLRRDSATRVAIADLKKILAQG